MLLVYVITILSFAISISLFSVWLVRSKWATKYRGGSAKTLKEEFTAYGYPLWFFYLIGVLKIGIALILFFYGILDIYVYLLSGLQDPSNFFISIHEMFEIRLFSVLILIVLMLGALISHIKIKDSIQKMMPALLISCLSILIFLCYSPYFLLEVFFASIISIFY